jgi:HD superfamily phosphodiesterase
MKNIKAEAMLPELPRLAIEIQLLTILNECLRTQLDCKQNGIEHSQPVIDNCNEIISRYTSKFNIITASGQYVED